MRAAALPGLKWFWWVYIFDRLKDAFLKKEEKVLMVKVVRDVAQ